MKGLDRALRAIRLYHRDTQKSAAEKTSIGKTLICDMERDSKPISLKNLRKYADGYCMDVSDIAYLAECLNGEKLEHDCPPQMQKMYDWLVSGAAGDFSLASYEEVDDLSVCSEDFFVAYTRVLSLLNEHHPRGLSGVDVMRQTECAVDTAYRMCQTLAEQGLARKEQGLSHIAKESDMRATLYHSTRAGRIEQKNLEAENITSIPALPFLAMTTENINSSI